MVSSPYGIFGLTPPKRRVFFSFHYQNDIWRVNQVRNSWRYGNENTRIADGFFDGSIWENSQRTSDDSLKNLIREGIKNTTVTCILVGSNTFERRWVRYEIARSIIKGNGLLGVRINALKNQSGSTAYAGPNPLDFMGVYRSNDGRILLAERNAQGWVRYLDYTQGVTLPNGWALPTSLSVVPLGVYASQYCYVADDGASNFPSWVRQAAAEAGK